MAHERAHNHKTLGASASRHGQRYAKPSTKLSGLQMCPARGVLHFRGGNPVLLNTFEAVQLRQCVGWWLKAGFIDAYQKRNTFP